MILKKKRYDGSYIQMRISDEATWAEAADEFINFLQGCHTVNLTKVENDCF